MPADDLSPDEVEAVRQLRGFAVAWEVVAARLGRSVEQCRRAIGMPAPPPPNKRPVLPWEHQQRSLFE